MVNVQSAKLLKASSEEILDALKNNYSLLQVKSYFFKVLTAHSFGQPRIPGHNADAETIEHSQSRKYSRDVLVSEHILNCVTLLAAS